MQLFCCSYYIPTNSNQLILSQLPRTPLRSPRLLSAVAMPRPINGMALSTNKIFIIIFAVGCSALILMNLSLGHFHHYVTNNRQRQHVDSSFILQNSNSINNEEQRMKIGSQEQHSNNNRQ